MYVPDIESLDDFYNEHCYCDGNIHYDLELCEEFPLEMTDNERSIDDY